MKTLLLLLLFTFSCYADPPDHANNPDGDDMPDEANCVFCDTVPIKHKAILAFGAIALGLALTYRDKEKSIYKPKKHS